MGTEQDLTAPEQIAVRWLREGDCVSTAGKEGPFREIRELRQEEEDPTAYTMSLEGDHAQLAMDDIVWARLARPEKIRIWPANTATQTTERAPAEVAAEFLKAVDAGYEPQTPGSVEETFIEWLSTDAGIGMAYERRDRRWLVQALQQQVEDRPELRDRATADEPFPEDSGSHRVDLDALRSGDET
jgi:hypothetical protein